MMASIKRHQRTVGLIERKGELGGQTRRRVGVVRGVQGWREKSSCAASRCSEMAVPPSQHSRSSCKADCTSDGSECDGQPWNVLLLIDQQGS